MTLKQTFARKDAPTFTFRIWIAGDYDAARATVRRYCAEHGFCAALQRTDYIYTGGEESGLCVTIINYARFPKSDEELDAHAEALGDILARDLCQGSYSIEGARITSFYSRRGDI